MQSNDNPTIGDRPSEVLLPEPVGLVMIQRDDCETVAFAGPSLGQFVATLEASASLHAEAQARDGRAVDAARADALDALGGWVAGRVPTAQLEAAFARLAGETS